MAYLFWRWLHIVAVISWMAGLLYIFRLFIYHVENRGSADIMRLLPVMERRLYRIITVPAMIVALVAATGMLWQNEGLLSQTWLHIKMLCVFLLVGFTAYAGSLVKLLRDESGSWPTARKLRILNEGPTLLMLIIVFMVVFKPFG